jgi:hypothetical protein
VAVTRAGARARHTDRRGTDSDGRGGVIAPSGGHPTAHELAVGGLMQRGFGVDVLACPRCGDRLELIALIDDPTVIRRILSHLGGPSTSRPHGQRGRRRPMGRSDPWYDEDVSVS